MRDVEEAKSLVQCHRMGEYGIQQSQSLKPQHEVTVGRAKRTRAKHRGRNEGLEKNLEIED
jgi:hypothetical protein